jgi:hypothetical protein
MAEEDEASAASHIRALRRELASLRGALRRLDEEVARTAREAGTEQASLAACRRREQLASDIGDAETVRLAREFAARHDERHQLLTRKLAVLRDERALLARDLETMEAAVPATRDNIGAGGRTASTPDDDETRSDSEFGRMQRAARERAAAERLEELKRRMR